VPDEVTEYLTALGWFIDRYAELERMAVDALEEGAGVPLDLLWTLTGTPLRLHNIVPRLRGIAEHRLDADAQAELEDAFTQLERIRKVRDRLIHRGAYTVAHPAMIVIKQRAGRRELAKDDVEIQLSPGALHDMTHDVWTIHQRLVCHFYALGLDAETRGVVCAEGRRAWRYTLPPQEPPGPTRQTTR
jgi:hypothetical protein